MRRVCPHVSSWKNLHEFDVHVTVHRRHIEDKEPTLPQHVSGTNMPIIRSTISEYHRLLGGHTWKAAWTVPHWASWSDRCLEAGSEKPSVAQPRRLSRHGHLKAEESHKLYSWRWAYWCPKHVEAIKTAYFVASSWFFTFTKPIRNLLVSCTVDLEETEYDL
jgi:hypothetical protein